MNIGTYTIDDYLHLVKSFHGNLAPGLIIGGFMVDLAMKSLPEGVLYDSICETGTCLPDAVQLLTPCTVGNGWLRVMEFGRFAVCLFDKYTGDGVRVFLDPKRLDDWPEIRDWFFKLRPKKDQDPAALRDRIIDAGTEILALERVHVDIASLGKKGKGPIATCPSCGEAYPARDGATCLACQGNAPYLRELQAVRPGLKVIPASRGEED